MIAPSMSRIAAEVLVRDIYESVLGRNPFANPYDPGAYDWVMGFMYHDVTVVEAEKTIRGSRESALRAERIVRELYLELLGRDPGPEDDGNSWADPAALAYVEDFRLGKKTEEQMRVEIMLGPEYLERHSRKRATRPEVLDNVLHDTGTARKEFELGISLFYAMSRTREEYVSVLDELKLAGIRQVRLAGSTFTWDNPVGRENVIPFRPGTTYVHKEGVDKNKGVDPAADPAHLAELSWRLEMLVERGMRAQYTIFWGGMQPLFTTGPNGKPGHPPGEGGRDIIWERVQTYLEDIARFFAKHPEHTLEIINECDHGHHLGKIGQSGRNEFLRRCANIIRLYHPQAVITASDGGRTPEFEGDPYFRYNDVKELDYWNVHYPRDEVSVEGIPRWCRGSWHLYQDRDPFRKAHGGRGGYGRSDENIFLTTQAEFEKWGYRGGTRDWQMYGTMLWVTTMAGAGLTLHTFKGFFCEPGLTNDDIFRVVRGWNTITEDFDWHTAQSFNAGWVKSPVKGYDGAFKAFSLVSGGGKSILVTVLNPKPGVLYFNLDRERVATVYEIDGEPRGQWTIGPGAELWLPEPKYQHALIVRLD